MKGYIYIYISIPQVKKGKWRETGRKEGGTTDITLCQSITSIMKAEEQMGH